jgi:hypothetical protein
MLFEKRTCKEVAALVVAREDRALSLTERAHLHTHMWICKACPGFENQILTMRNAMRQWRSYAGDTSTPADPPHPVEPAALRATTRKDDIN